MQEVEPIAQGLIVTVDLEDHHGAGGQPRFQAAIKPLLDALEAVGSRATFFVVGSLAENWADGIRDLADRGHEIALHSYEHSFIERLGRDGFREDLRRGIGVLGEILGTAPTGYRAPYFSLTRTTPWAPAELADAGLEYSSSVLPAWNPQAGLPGAPRSPFRWSSGLLEFPVPVVGLGPVGLPFLGGAYARLLPWHLVRLAARRAKPGAWTYSHPYDFDAAEPYSRLEGQPWWVARLLFMRRELMLERIMSLAGTGASPTLGDLARRLSADPKLPAFSLGDNQLRAA